MLFPTWTHLCVSLSFFIFQNAEMAARPSPAGTPVAANPSGAVNQDKDLSNGLHSSATVTHTPTADKSQPPVLKHSGPPPTAQQYEVPRKLPLMDFTLPQTYAGLIDVSETPGVVNDLFFWFVPTQNLAGRKDLVLWSNGGPGCSSLIGAFQENGPIMWEEGQKTAKLNPNSWHNHANMVYLEHPANVGFSRGNAVINNEDQVARYFFVFLQKFIQIFTQMRGANFYITGESYAGLYVSYAAEFIYRHQAQLALNLQGILLVDACISADAFQFDAPLLRFINKWNDKYLHLSPQVVAEITKLDAYCGASKYVTQSMKFPGSELTINQRLFDDPKCRIWVKMVQALPKGFNVYNIAKQEHQFNFAAQSPSYFDRPDVRKALHAEKGTKKWVECSSASNIFPHGDISMVPLARALPYVMAKSKRTVLLHGELDGLLLAEGSILSLQGYLWNGKYGFDKPINRKFMVGGKQKGLFVADAGHMVPQDQPEAALSALQYLLGRRDTV